MSSRPTISVVTPTLSRPAEVAELLADLARQVCPPDEVVVIDGAPPDDVATEEVVAGSGRPFVVRYLRSPRGTAVQRNAGLDAATGDLVAFIDDDVRLEPTFLAELVAVFEADERGEVGGVVGYRTGSYLGRSGRLPPRWRAYRALRLLRTFEPSAYDWATGYPINANLQPPFTGTRPVELMTTACAMWRREVFDDGLRFDPFFADYGVLEDAHLSLRAGRSWRLLQCGDAHCVELSAPGGRVGSRHIGEKSVANYWFVFADLAGPLRPTQVVRFWRYQAFEIVRELAHLAVHPSGPAWDHLGGRISAIRTLLRLRQPHA